MNTIYYPPVTPQEWVVVLAEAVVGIIMIYYGWPKVRDLHANAKDFDHKGFKPGIVWGTIAALVEFVGGITILVGAYPKVAAAVFGLEVVIAAIWKITKGKKPFSSWSYDVLLFTLCLVIIFFG